jgi:sugar lactone lactonase YvrE
MSDDSVSVVEKVIQPPAAPEVLVEDAGKAAQNLWWDDRDESLWWTDANGGRIYRLNYKTRIQSAIYEGPSVGAFIPQVDHTWLLFREKDVVVFDFESLNQVVPLIECVRVDGDRFNEVIADAEGRVLVGTVRDGRPNGAGIFRLETDGTIAKVLGGTGLSAGMGWNAKGDALYWCCGTTKTVWRCRYDVKRGALGIRQVFHECMPDEGTPAGLALDTEGTLWSARRGAGAILKIGENRRLMGQVTFPARDVTSIAFGGPDHRTLFAAAITDDNQSKIFMLQSPVPGMPLRRSRIKSPASVEQGV